MILWSWKKLISWFTPPKFDTNCYCPQCECKNPTYADICIDCDYGRHYDGSIT